MKRFEKIIAVIVAAVSILAMSYISAGIRQDNRERKQNIVVIETSFPTCQLEIAEDIEKSEATLKELEERDHELYNVAPVQPVEEVKYSEEEYELLSAVLMAENGADYVSDRALYLTGCVIMNRVRSEYYPDTIKEVVFQSGQYACTWNGGLYKYEPSERCYYIAEELLMNGVPGDIPENLVYQAEFVQGSVYEHIDGTYFGLR